MIALGPFLLKRRLGKGAMGEVWLAAHRDQGTEVALKVITERRAREHASQQSFASEMRSMAQLCHPRIVMLLDVGEVSVSAALESAGALVPRCPYLAMELGSGTLADAYDDITDFETLRVLLLQLLDGLAHAHARGVIHRDIKPMNVLLHADSYKLADFGVAHMLRDPHADQRQHGSWSGTPRYMSPEQVVGEIRDQGPWTDLYALGCVAWWLLTGDAPYRGNIMEVMRAHLEAAIPPLAPRFAIPDGLEAWLGGMLAKLPAERFRCAADAAHALCALSAVRDDAPVSRRSLPRKRDERDDSTLVLPTIDIAAPSALAGVGAEVAPLPATWRGAQEAVLPPQLLGAGLGLYNMRPVPLVDRDGERDVLWGALAAAAGSARVRAVVIRGAAGVGKSRLIEWFAQRAHELGAATPLKATHAPIAGPMDGIGAMVARHARAVGLERLDLLERLRRVQTEEGRLPFKLSQLELLADLVEGVARAQSRDQHHAVIQWLQAIARERPLLLWIDDAQWGVAALELCTQLLADTQAPILVALTVRDEALRHGSLADRLLADVEASDCCTRIDIAPLGADDHRTLVTRLLQLRSDLASMVGERTQGNPLFAVQLVGDWVERGILSVGAGGFELAAGETAPLPDSIHEMWSARLLRLWRKSSPEAAPALEIAASLGQDIDAAEWRAACDEAGVSIPAELVTTLLDMRLARALPRGAPEGWAFAHAMLRESVERHADEAGRRAAHHHSCASMLSKRGGDPLRIAEHLLAAEAWHDALAPLLEAAEACSRRGDFMQAHALDDRRDRALDRAGVAADAPERVMGWMRRARTCCLQGSIDQARAMLAKADGVSPDRADVEAAILSVRAIVARHDNRYAEGLQHSRRALALCAAMGDAAGVARSHKKLAELLRLTGQLDASIDGYRAAQEAFERLGDDFELAWTSMGLSATHRQHGDIDTAHAHAERGLIAFERIGSRLGIGHANNELGEVERLRGNHAAAEKRYQLVLDAWSDQRHRDLDLIRFNIAAAALGAGDHRRAAGILHDVLEVARARGGLALETYALTGLCHVAALDGDDDGCRALLPRIEALLDELSLVDIDIAQALSEVGAHTQDDALARRMYARARAQWQALGDATWVQRIDERVQRIDERVRRIDERVAQRDDVP
jgi:tetratricopeptide (TPR) repeat protein